MYIYMGKRKPKHCWMKWLDVSPKTILSFYWRWTDLFSPPSHSTFLLTEKTDLLNLPFLLSWDDEIRLQKKRVHITWTLNTSFYVGYPIFSQLKYPLFILWTLTSIPYLFRNNCTSIGRSRATPMGGIGETVLVSINMPFSRRWRLSLHAALPLFFTTILESAIICL